MFSLSLLTSVLQGVALFATNFLLMVYFQGIRGISVLTASSLLVPLFVSLMVLAPIGGRLSDRYGPRVVATSGLLVQGLAIFLMSTIDAGTPLWLVAGFEGLLGVGAGLFFPANTAATMGAVPRERYGVASGTMMTFRNSAVAMSYVLALVAAHQPAAREHRAAPLRRCVHARASPRWASPPPSSRASSWMACTWRSWSRPASSCLRPSSVLPPAGPRPLSELGPTPAREEPPPPSASG